MSGDFGSGVQSTSTTAEPRDGAEPVDRRSEIVNRELQRRLERFDELEDADFGAFGALDWTACVFLFFVLPLFIVWWFA